MALDLEVYQYNTLTINCTVTGLSLTGYTPYFTVKSDKSSAALISNIGTVTDASHATFYVSSTDTSIAGKYSCGINFECDSSIYTGDQGTIYIKPAVRQP